MRADETLSESETHTAQGMAYGFIYILFITAGEKNGVANCHEAERGEPERVTCHVLDLLTSGPRARRGVINHQPG